MFLCAAVMRGLSLIIGGAATSIIFVATRQNASFVATKVCLSRQNYVCRDKRFVATNTCFVATKIILVAAPANDSL